MRLIFLLYTFLFFNATQANAQTIRKKDQSPAIFIPLNFKSTQYKPHAEYIDTIVADFFKKDTIGRDLELIIYYSLYTSPTYSISINPSIEKEQLTALQSKIKSIPPPTPLFIPFTDYHFLKTNGGSNNRKNRFKPAHTINKELDLIDYKGRSLDEQFEMIKTWISESVFPLLLKTLDKTADLEDAVKQYLGDLAKIKWNEPNLADKYSVNNSLYWRALENSNTLPSLLPCLNVFLLVHDGKFAYARTYLNLIYNLHQPPRYILYLLHKTFERVQFYEQNEQQWAKNLYYVKLGGDQNKAIETCKQVLTVNSNSVNALSYLIETNATMQTDSTFDYAYYETRLLNANPMISYLFFVQNKKEAYQQHLRKKSVNYFVDPAALETDYFDFLETAIQLDNFALAADLALLIQRNEHVKEIAPFDLSLYYDYSIYKMDNALKKGRALNRKFRRLDRKYKKKMKKHHTYKNFKY